MADYVYPRSDLDRPQRILELLGTHWSSTYGGSKVVEDLVRARAEEAAQTHLDLLEAVAAVSRLTVRVFHTDNWYLLTLLESEVNGAEISIRAYGDDAVYGGHLGGGTELRYGTPHGIGLYSFPLPAELKDVKLVFNRITAPSVTLTSGLDFIVDPVRGAIHFRGNPFTNDWIAKRDVYAGDEVVNREVGLWVFRGQFDWQAVYAHFGYLLKLKMQSSEGYRELLNAILDGIVRGSNYLAIAAAFSVLADAPIVVDPEETVEAIWTEPGRRLLIATDKRIYRYGELAEPNVVVGDTVRAGDQLTDAYTIYEFNRGQLSADLRAVTLDRRVLTTGYYDGVTFVNEEVPVVVDTSGVFTKVSFELGGWPGDVVKFWTDFHVRGVQAGETLAHLLDTRTNKVGEPVATNLPAIINPLKFLVENVLRDNAYVVKLKPRRFGEDALGVAWVRELRRIIPPHTICIVIVELDAPGDVVTMDGAGDENGAGYEESHASYYGAEGPSDVLDPDTLIAEEEPILRHVAGVCL